jgi:hypothetical protein
MLASWLEANAASPPRFGPPIPEASGPLAPLYRGFNGQLDGPPLVGAHRFMSLDEALAEKRMMDELAAKEGWEAGWWSPDWHPFASDLAGQLLVVDAPTGKVLEFVHDDEGRPEIAPDLDRLITRIWTALNAGKVLYDPEFGIGTAEEIARYHEAAARRPAQAPKPEGRPHAALALGLIPTFATLGVGIALDLGAGPTAIAATAVALAMTGVGWWLGWVVYD